MQTVILDDIRPQIAQGDLLKRLRVAKGSPLAAELLDLLGQAESIARPKALCGLTYIDDRGEDFVVAKAPPWPRSCWTSSARRSPSPGPRRCAG